MRINLTIDVGRPRRRAVGLVVAGLLLLTPAVVLATHQFSDVPESNIFHDDIAAIAGAGVTAGFGDGGYHPSSPVTRQAMAAFMQRGFGRAGLAIGDRTMGVEHIVVDTNASATTPVAVRQLTIVVPGESNAFNPTQLVHLQGRVEFYDGMLASRGCPCWFYALIRDMTTDEASVVQSETFETATTDGAYAYSLDAEALFVAPPGPRTYQLEAALYYRTVPSPSVNFFMSSASSLSAMTFPFGPAGTSDL